MGELRGLWCTNGSRKPESSPLIPRRMHHGALRHYDALTCHQWTTAAAAEARRHAGLTF